MSGIHASIIHSNWGASYPKCMKTKQKNQKVILFAITLLCSLISLKAFSSENALNTPLNEGDIIFHQSQSDQSAALREASGSPWTHVGFIVKNPTNSNWYVAEAVQPVKVTRLEDFIARGKNKSYKIFRFKYFNQAKHLKAFYQTLQGYMGRDYDIYFEFNNDRIYCSELTYKVMKTVTGQELGRIQKMREMRLDGPYVQELIDRRLTDIGKELNLDEEIITPISQMNDSDLVLIKSQ